ncbi:MAG: DUF1838 domain-containing protein [Sinobacteraceae bacterium]|nr:DUF1838 domain-containing protein [Nevskiaceae bacterium]
MSTSDTFRSAVDLDRRHCLGAALALGAVAASGETAPASLAGKVGPERAGPELADLRDPRQRSLAFRKLAWSMDEGLSFWWLRGVRYGMRGSVATPFWDMHVGLWFRTRDIGNDTYEVLRAGANFYTPLGESALLEQFANPFTGQTVPVRYATPRIAKQTYAMDGSGPTREAAAGVNGTTVSTIGPAWLEGDELAIQGDVVIRNEPSAPGQRPFNVNDWSTYVGSWREVRDPANRNPAAAQTFTDVLDFPAWLQMGDTQGTFVSRCYGRKVTRYEDMPAIWRRHFEARFPDIARNPAAMLKG